MHVSALDRSGGSITSLRQSEEEMLFIQVFQDTQDNYRWPVMSVTYDWIIRNKKRERPAMFEDTVSVSVCRQTM